MPARLTHRGFSLGKKRDVDMTQGNIAKHIIYFAIPLLIGNLFQQLYNTVDTWVIGNYASNEAYSAVGNVGPITNLLIGFFMGFSSGAGVVISQYYGAKKESDVGDTVHTAIAMTLIMGVAFTAIGLFMIPFVLDLMKMPAEVRPYATDYLTIYFSGIIAQMLYNVGAGILRAVGDSQRPFYFLMVAAIMNTVLDLVFVLAFGWGVKGVALATILSQAVSAVLVLITLCRSTNCIRLRPRKIRLHLPILKKIIFLGIPTALRMSITSFSNIFAQSYINSFGANCMSGWTTYTKVDQVLFLPMQSISLACTTFVGQNLGADQIPRTRKGVRLSLSLSIVATAILMVPVVFFAPYIVRFFNSKPEVIHYGTLLLRWLTPFYLLSCFTMVYSSALQGAGNTKAPMIIMLSSYVVFRQIYLFSVTQAFVPLGITAESTRIILTGMAYPAGWLLCAALTLIYYSRADLSKTRLVSSEQ